MDHSGVSPQSRDSLPIDFDYQPLSYTVSRPQISAENLLVDTTKVYGGPFLQFKYAALKSKIPRISPRDLKQGKYLARGQCSQVVVARWRANDVAVKRIVNRKASLVEVWILFCEKLISDEQSST